MRDLALDRPLVARLGVCALFALVLVSFLLPFLDASIDERRGSATGLELANGEPQLSGRYVHGAFEGQVEEVFADGHGPARAALIATALGTLLAWLPWRIGPALGSVAAGVALAAMFVLFQTAGAAFAETVWRLGYWLALLGLGAVGAAAVALWAWTPWWWRPRQPTTGRDYFASPDTR